MEGEAVSSCAARPFFIVNPRSANGTTRARFESLLPRLRGMLPDLVYAYTSAPMHAAELAQEAVGWGATMVVSCGGDGTLNEVVCGLVASGKPALPVLALMPSGTGGDFRKVLNLGSGPRDALNCLLAGVVRAVDFGVLQFLDHDGKEATRAFINIASAGISGLVDHYVNHTTKAFGGRISFLLGTVRGTFAYRNAPVRVVVDGQVFYEGRVRLVAVANGRFFGGGMMITPNAMLNDGLLDVTVLGDMNQLEFLSLARHIYSGTHLAVPKVLSTRGRAVMVEPLTDSPVLIDLDGEQPGRIFMGAEVVPKGLRVLVPRGSLRTFL